MTNSSIPLLVKSLPLGGNPDDESITPHPEEKERFSTTDCYKPMRPSAESLRMMKSLHQFIYNGINRCFR